MVSFVSYRYLLILAKIRCLSLPTYRFCHNYSMPTKNRPVCAACHSRPRAVAYHKYGRIYYRSMCEVCHRRGKRLKTQQPRWKIAGYRKKNQCDRCGFKARIAAQISVFHLDGNLNNCDLRNLKSICLNCTVEIARSDLPWVPGDIEPDR